MWAKNNNNNELRTGFTIVELLVVIVVISILAAITVVSYNGVRDRAKLSSTYTTVKTYQTHLKTVSLKGGLPTSVNACLGTPSEYSGTPSCSIGGQNANPVPTLNTSLTNAGMKDQPKLTSLAPAYQQIMYAISYYSNPAVILYNLPGNATDCGVQPVLSQHPNTSSWGYHNANYTTTSGVTTTCIIGINP